MIESNRKKENDTEKNNLSSKLEETCNMEGDFGQIARTFDEMGLKPEISHGIYSHGFTRPSPIQSRAIIPCIEGKDVIAQAQSGTGKTATFVISILQRIDTSPNVPVKLQALVLAPTRELASQIKIVFTEIGQFSNLKIHGLIGGTSVQNDVSALKAGVHVIVGTPGRVSHLIEMDALSLIDVKVLVLDEADEMLSRGFREKIYHLYSRLPSNLQCILLSATIPESVMEVTKQFMNNPVTIYVKKELLTLQGIRQYFVVAEDRNNKADAVIEFLGESNIPQMVIFVNSQKDAHLLTKVLNENGFEVLYLHAGLTHTERVEIMRKFRCNECRFLVSTDLISRGIDVQGVALVINFDLPRDKESYIHRIGRSGRYGRAGISINLVTQDELKYMREIESFYNTSIQELPQDIQSLFLS